VTAQPDRELTASTVARILRIHINTVRRWVEEGRFQSYKRTCTGRILIMASEIEALKPKK